MTSSIALVLRPSAPLSAEGHEEFAERVHEFAAATPGARQVCVGSRPPPRLSVIPFARQPAAVVLASGVPDHTPGLVAHAYRVETSEPLPGPEQGVGMITLFSRRPGLDASAFMTRWHEGHSPLALSVHPLIRYVRHRVVEPLGKAPPRDGIVLEMTPRQRDVLSPIRFFGGPLRALPNMVRIGLDARGFLDLSTIENQLVRVSSL